MLKFSAARGETVGCFGNAKDVPFGLASVVDGQPWVDVTIPLGTAPGVYSSPCATVTVHGFDMPKIPMPFYVGLNPERVKRVEGRDAYDEYDAMLKAHGIDRPLLPMPKYDWVTGQINDLGTHADLLPTRPLWLLPVPFGFDQWAKAQAYLHGYGVWLKSVGASNVAVYMVDEPNNRTEEGRKRQEQARLLGTFLADTKSPIMSMIPGAHADLYQIPVDLPVYFWGSPYSTYKRCWVYTALNNRGKAPTWLETSPDADFIAALFAVFSTGAEGIWYWTAVLDSPYGEAFPGEGEWIKKGPTASRSLKLIREGINCWQYLMMLKDRDLAKRLARVVAPSFQVWERDVSMIYTVKDLVARHLEIK